MALLENKDPTQLDRLLQTQNGQKWLKGPSGKQWLQQAKANDGLAFDQMKSVDIWLKHFVTDPAVYFATEDEVIAFLKQDSGKYWLTTDHGKIWSISERGGK